MKARAEASERLSGEIIASLTSGLLVVDQDGTLRTLNPAARKLLDLTDADAAIGFRAALTSAPALADVIEECLSEGEPILRRTLSLHVRPDVPTQVGVTASPMRDEEGHAHGAICLFTDLSAIVELEEQLRLKDSLARLGELTAGIAHEFRNGLATIHGYARLVDLERLPEDARPCVQGIRDDTEALGQIVTNFLNFARPSEPALAPVDMKAIADRAADEIRADARSKGGSVTVLGTFARVEGDEVLLRQAFSNLCRNAIEACASVGTPPRIAIEGALEPGHLRISVVDNGPGIDPKVASRMFRPFVTTRPHGTGLGLALVQKIVVLHNGRVTAQGESGGGTRFAVTLPTTRLS